MNFYAIPPLITSIILMILSAAVLLHNVKARLNQLFALFSFSIAVWLLGYSFMYLSASQEEALKWARAGFIGVLFIPIFALHLIFAYLEINRKVLLRFLYALSLPFLIISQTQVIYSGIKKHFWGFYPVAGSLYWVVWSMFGLLFVISLIFLFKHFHKEKGARREQIKYLFLAFMVGLTGAVDYAAKYPKIEIYPFGYICAFMFAFLIAIAIVRYRFLDIKIALTRTGIFLLVYAIVLGLPMLLTIYGRKFFSEKFGSGWYWLPLTMLFSLATMAPFSYNFLRRQAEDILLKEQRKYQAALSELAKTLIEIKDIRLLCNTISAVLVNTVKSSFAVVYLLDEEQRKFCRIVGLPWTGNDEWNDELQEGTRLISMLKERKRILTSYEMQESRDEGNKFELIIPFISKQGLLGFVVVGEKIKEQVYSRDDITAMEAFANSSALAIENCLFWREIEDRQRKARLKEMDAYSYALAHEIDNPMQSIVLQAGLLKESLPKAFDQEQQKQMGSWVDYISESAQRVSALVKAIREYGKAQEEAQELSIKDVVDSFQKLYYPQFKANDVDFKYEIEPNLPAIKGRKPELMQVFVILANNSIEAMKQSTKKEIELKAVKAEDGKIRITFSDTGCGIKKELIPSLFSPFTTTKAASGGTGMGLYNARKIVERYLGTIKVEFDWKCQRTVFIINLK